VGTTLNELREPGVIYDATNYKHAALTKQIIRVFYEVYNALGYGFLEKVCENALAMRLRRAGLSVVEQQPIQSFFDGQLIGENFADLVVNDLVVVELKAVKELVDEHEAQLLHYLRATRYEVGLLLNFGPLPKVVRKAYDNQRKPNLPRNNHPKTDSAISVSSA
jgi:GxxExxY protein